MSTEILVYVTAVCLLSGFAHGAIGFGFPVVATPLVALAIDMKSAIALLAPVTLVVVVISALRGGGVRGLLRDFWFLPVGIAAGAWLGTRILLAAPPEPFTLALALILLFYLNLDRIVGGGKSGHSDTVQRLRVLFGLAFAFVAGIFEAIANVAGPMLLVYFMLLGAAPQQIVQTLNLCFSVGKGSQVATLAASGALAGTWLAVAGLTVPALVALAAGMRLRERIDAETYRRWLRKALWVMAVVLLAQFAHGALASEPLFREIDSHRERAALDLVERGQADLNARNANGDTLLHRAVETGMRRLLQALLAAGADPTARNSDGESTLHWAALSGHIVVAQRLLARGADPRIRTRNGFSARDYARREGHSEIAKLLERFDR